MKILTIITGFLAALTVTAGLVFKIMHLPGAMLLLLSGAAIGVLLFLPMLVLVNRKNKK